MTPEGYTEMKVHRLVLDPNTNSPIVILQAEDSGVMLPIWIGIFEAHAIAMKLEGIDPPRPMTHDLLRDAIGALHGSVERVEVVDLVDNTYFARVCIQVHDQHVAVDSRPSDAIALALRLTSPIFVANHVLDKSRIDPALEAGTPETAMDGAPEEEAEEDQWTRILKGFNPPGGSDKIN